MDYDKCTNCGKDVPSNSLELHTMHCKRNYVKCECGEVINKQSFDAHMAEKHTAKPCKHCGLELLPEALAIHDCPSLPKLCQFCNAEFPFDQFSEHLYRCSSRTEQCPRCFKYIQIRDYDHHVEQIDCLGVRNKEQERIEKIACDVYENFIGDPAEIEQEILRRLAEAEDREYAEEVYKKLIMERSPSRDSHNEEPSPVKVNTEHIEHEDSDLKEAIEQSLMQGQPELQRGVSESSWGVSEEDQLMNEVIMKSLQDR
ncbi:hypothetical protein SteCoe_20228 [Stentor coeruleus]|uniref:TRAF-type domain-containing protein n=1 Tax=Stentor coeruleus TaxID=5963 RepID=A0A1R2BSR7_9CILI|nr:hypothetical protein SteCoe_20228 [Stentor coeruleus]